MLAKVLDRGADAVIVDLEDAVAPSKKGLARRIVADWLAGLGGAEQLPAQVWVRVNPGPLLADDVAAIVSSPIIGVYLAKAEAGAPMAAIDEALSRGEQAAGLNAGSVQVCPLLESARAVVQIAQVAAAPRVVRLGVGEVDLAAELGIEAGPDGTELDYIRSQVIVHSAAAGLAAPVGPVWTDIPDAVGLRRSSERLRRMGFGGRACIHPAQVAVVNEVFSPGPDEIAAARQLVDLFEAAIAAGDGVVTDALGRMLDEAVVRAARRTLAAVRDT